MSRYSGKITFLVNGVQVPVAGAQIYVYNSLLASAQLETLTADGGGALTNPVIADEYGDFYFNSADGQKKLDVRFGGERKWREDILVGPPATGPAGINGGVGSSAGFAALFGAASGMVIGVGITAIDTSGYSVAGIGGARYIYDAAVTAGTVALNPRTQFIAADARGFKLDNQQRLTIEMFGGRGDGSSNEGDPAVLTGTLNDDAVAAALAFAPHSPISVNMVTGPTIHFGIGAYRFANYINIKRIISFVGMGGGHQQSGASQTQFLFPASTKGIISHSFYTMDSGLDPLAIGLQTAGSGFKLEGIQLVGGGGAADGLSHGFWGRGVFTLRDVTIGGSFAGNGIHNVAFTAHADPSKRAQTNSWVIDSVSVKTPKGHGMFVDGNDCNAGTATSLKLFAAQCALYENSYLGNTYTGLECDGFGIDATRGYVSFGGITYVLIDPTPGIGEATTPGTNDLIWYDDNSGATGAAWTATPTLPYQIGLPIYDGGGRNSYFHVYIEGKLAHIKSPSVMYGGQSGATRFSPFLRPVVGSGFMSNVGLSAILDRDFKTLPPAHAYGLAIGVELGTDIFNGVLDTFYAQGNGKHLNRRLLKTSWKVDYVIDSTNIPAFGYTIRGATSKFGKGTETVENTFFARQIALGNGGTNDGDYRLQRYGSAAPTTGEHAVGQFVWNQAPTAAGTLGWTCVTAGTPGTWKAVSGIAA